MSLTKKYLINGPVNIIRLENNNKVLYLLSDINNEVINECKYNKKSMNIDDFLLLFIKNQKNKKYNLYLNSNELYHTDTIYSTNYKLSYIESMDSLFLFLKKNKQLYSNFKIKFVNITHHFDYYDMIYYANVFRYDANGIRKYINLINIFKLIKNFYRNLKNKNNKYITNFLFNDYIDDNVKLKILNIYKIYVLSNYKLLLKLIKDTIYKLKNNFYNRDYKFINNIKEDIFNINKFITNIYTVLNDLYFIKKFINNNVKNNIYYSNIPNVSNIIYILIKYFDFKLTHISHNKYKYNFDDIKYLSNTNLSYISIITEKIINKYKNKYYQCSNMFNFPNNFE